MCYPYVKVAVLSFFFFEQAGEQGSFVLEKKKEGVGLGLELELETQELNE